MGNLQKTKINLNNFRYENVYHPEDGMDHTEEVIKVCGYCPENYPWLHNPEGNQISGQNLKQSRNTVHKFTTNNLFSFYDTYFPSKNILECELVKINLSIQQ